LPALKFISVMATGVNVVDLQVAQENGILVSNVVGYSTSSVAQHTFALILELTNRVGMHSQGVAQGQWVSSPDWSYWKHPLKELAGKTLGIIGIGHIGKQVARIGKAMGMEVIAYHPKLSVSVSVGGSSGEFEVNLMSLEDIFKLSDVLTLHCPLNNATHHLVNKQRLSIMKSQALLINTARGPLIKEDDLKWALDNKVIAGAALDVLSEEPPTPDHPLIGLPNCIITPHQAWASWESRRRLMEETIMNVQAFLEGNPRNLVTP